jgi:hypothetical protein
MDFHGKIKKNNPIEFINSMALHGKSMELYRKSKEL